METAESITILSAGTFFLVGLLTGVWKYRQIMTSEDAQAHPYVDICHRASLLYAFATMLLLKFLEISELNSVVELVAVSFVLFYFASAIFTYFLHGLLKDTDNQFKSPHHIGKTRIRANLVSMSVWSLIAAELGGFLVIFYGVILALF